MAEEIVIGVDIGGTKIAAGLVQPDGQIAHALTEMTPSGGAAAILEAATGLCRVLQGMTGAPVRALGVGAAGQVDRAQGVIAYANDNLPGWMGTPVKAVLEAELGLPVVVDNDVNAMAFGESQVGAGTGYPHLLYIAVGTGIGGAIVHDGRVWRGAHHSAGELGYLVAGWHDQQPVIVEQLASGPGIAARYRALSGSHDLLTLYEIAARARQGETLAAESIREGAHLLGTVLAPVVCLLDPQMVIVGGGVPGIGDLWWQPFEAALRANPLPALQQVKLARAHFEANAVMIGAAQLAYTLIRPSNPPLVG